jgi:hypothetical protein
MNLITPQFDLCNEQLDNHLDNSDEFLDAMSEMSHSSIYEYFVYIVSILIIQNKIKGNLHE